MADLFATGMGWLAEQLKEHAAADVTYRRGPHEVTLAATKGRTLLRFDDPTGAVRREWTDRDYIVTASDLVLNEEVVEPQRGDTVEETVGEATHVYEVLTPSGDEAVWRWADAQHTMRRIHTKLLRVVE